MVATQAEYRKRVASLLAPCMEDYLVAPGADRDSDDAECDTVKEAVELWTSEIKNNTVNEDANSCFTVSGHARNRKGVVRTEGDVKACWTC